MSVSSINICSHTILGKWCEKLMKIWRFYYTESQVVRSLHCIHLLWGHFACYSVIGRGKHWQLPSSFTPQHGFFYVETGSDLESISDDIPGAAHLTDTFLFLCPCATLSALVHAQTTLTLALANTQGVNELKSLIPKPIQPAQCGVLPPVFSFFARQRVTEWKGQTCSSPTNSTPTDDSALKVEQRIKGLIIPLTLKWDNVWNFCERGLRQSKVLLNYSLDKEYIQS